jgi:RND family efflux transporter MFP subunit
MPLKQYTLWKIWIMPKLNLFAAILCSLILSACNPTADKPAAGSAPRLVRVSEVGSAGQDVFRELPGVVAASQEAQLAFRISGTIKKLTVKQGDHVDAGQVLALLDDTDINIQLKNDNAQYERALADFNRGKALVKQGTISQSDYNRLQSQLAASKAALEASEQRLLYSSLTAPFKGRIGKRYVENFEEVQAKQTIYTLQDIASIDIKVDLPESLMILANINNLPEVTAMFDAIPDRQFPLTMKEIATQADAETKTYEITLSMPEIEGYNILPGMSVTVRANESSTNTQSANSIYVPAQAILEDNEGRYAFVATLTQDNLAKVERRQVVTGNLSSAGLEIISGLNNGDKLIVAGMSKMYPDLVVRLEQESGK